MSNELGRRQFLQGLAAAGLATSAFAQTKPRKPNVLIIAIDDLNDWIGCYGGHPQVKTPNIDRLGRRGVVFKNAHCQAPICNPSRPSLLTGLRPSTTGHYYLKPDFTTIDAYDGATTLPEYFAENGYATFGCGKIFHGSTKHANHFQTFGPRSSGGPKPPKKISYPMGHPLWDWGAFPERDDQMPDLNLANWTADRLAEDHDKPFLMACGFFRPHVPMYAPQKWFDMYPRDEVMLPEVRENDREDVPQYGRDMTVGVTPPPHGWIVEHGEWRHAVQAYLACVSFADHCVGVVLDALDKRADADNTVVILFGDHGFHLGEKQYWAKRSLWDRATKVPMIISAPGRKPGESMKPVELLDIYSTLVDVCGLPENEKLEGQSLDPLLKNPKRAWPRPAITTYGQNNHGVRSERYRYIRYADGSEELYDHESDPNEWTNVLARHSPEGEGGAKKPENAAIIAAHKKWLPKVNADECEGTGGTGWQASQLAKGLVTEEELRVE